MDNNLESLRHKEPLIRTHAKSPFLLLITILLTINLLFIVFSASVNTTLLDQDFVEQELEQYRVDKGYESDEDFKNTEKLFEHLRSVFGLFNMVFYLLVLFSLILMLFVVFIARKDVIKMLMYLSAAAVFASVLSYAASIIGFMAVSNEFRDGASVFSEKIIINILFKVSEEVKHYSVVLLFLGILALALAYISFRMVKFLTGEKK